MISKRTKRFKQLLRALPKDVQAQATAAYRLFKNDPDHPGLSFKPVETRPSLYSVRIGLHYRALGVKQGDTIVWVWIGSHAEYDKFLR
jgi:hypothetical protein